MTKEILKKSAVAVCRLDESESGNRGHRSHRRVLNPERIGRSGRTAKKFGEDRVFGDGLKRAGVERHPEIDV